MPVTNDLANYSATTQSAEAAKQVVGPFVTDLLDALTAYEEWFKAGTKEPAAAAIKLRTQLEGFNPDMWKI